MESMNYCKAYIKENGKWIAAVLANGLMMAAIMYMNKIPVSEILYGVLVCVTVAVVIVAVRFSHYYDRCKELEQLARVITVSSDGMEAPKYLYETQYQTCIKYLEQENNKIQNEMLDRQQDMAEYYSMWVHQIKTPIAALKLLIDEESMCDSSVHNTAQKQQELFRIEQYVNMALQYMRLDSQSHDFVIRKVCVDEVLKASIHKYARQFVHKKLGLSYESSPICAVTDEKWIGFVIEQLLSNAIKYTLSGKITIEVIEQEQKTQEDATTKKVHIAITDTGIGIRAEDLPRICEKGYTGCNGHDFCAQKERQSTGIGLYLCNRILNKLGHQLYITSTEGVGTRAEIVI